ncbi:MAG: hypothetical protein HC845_11610 [Akkermansiaceae bacterium]|nr:hypothetical protein [Akkermansiaceae bacterium]
MLKQGLPAISIPRTVAPGGKHGHHLGFVIQQLDILSALDAAAPSLGFS